jgi:hypothetical protein
MDWMYDGTILISASRPKNCAFRPENVICYVWLWGYVKPVSHCNAKQLFLGNGSVNTFLLLGSRFLDYNNGRPVFSVWSVPRYCHVYPGNTTVNNGLWI